VELDQVSKDPEPHLQVVAVVWVVEVFLVRLQAVLVVNQEILGRAAAESEIPLIRIAEAGAEAGVVETMGTPICRAYFLVQVVVQGAELKFILIQAEMEEMVGV